MHAQFNVSVFVLIFKKVGLLDIDVCGPSIPRMVGADSEQVFQSGEGWSPVFVNEKLGVMSIAFLLEDPKQAVIWKGPKKNGASVFQPLSSKLCRND